MKQKSTKELERALGKTHLSDVEDFLTENKDSILSEEKPFAAYMKEIFDKKNLKRSEVFVRADISEGYGYKLLTEEKKTRQRDIILRLCYAAGMTLAETQQALKIYEMPELYAKIARDAIIMICFNERPGSVIDVNVLLEKHGEKPLRSSGIQE